MRVTALELPARWGDSQAVISRIDTLLSTGPRTQLVLLPEASLTGYVSPKLDFDLSPFAEPLEGHSAQQLRALAMKHQTLLVGPLIERAPDGRLYNSQVGFDALGDRVLHYRKRHPWYPETWATPGEHALPLLELDGLTLTVAVCFDLHFLPAESADQLEAADVLLFSSAWVGDGDDALRPKLRALAAQFELSVLNANWGHGTPGIRGQGGSVIIDSHGSVLAQGAVRIDADLEQ